MCEETEDQRSYNYLCIQKGKKRKEKQPEIVISYTSGICHFCSLSKERDSFQHLPTSTFILKGGVLFLKEVRAEIEYLLRGRLQKGPLVTLRCFTEF